MSSSYSDSEREEIIYQFLYKQAEEKGRHSCSVCGGSYSFDNIYMCRKCGKFWGYCCVPEDRICSKANCLGTIQ
ncbi:MAG: hypothetical protein KME09_01295 [Pleurocapsa minor HA4230-MV1]|nr:hypothetical protein [Pleurocapsa minor HA4230-MV1]